jgi:hypothetical protein
MRMRKSSWLLPLLVLSCVFFLDASIPNVPTGTWQNWNAMGEVRSGAAAVLLHDGRVLIIGGSNANGPVASADLFGTDGVFSAAAAMQTPRSRHTATVLSDGRVLVTGGVTSSGGAVNTAEIYDPSADSWSASVTMVDARAGHTASLLSDGRVLLAGGSDSAGNALSSLEIFDPASGAFSSAGAMSSPRMNQAAATLSDGRVLIIGGTADGTNALGSIDIYDPSAGTVSAGPALSTPRISATATTTLDGKVAVIGGNNGSASGSQDLASAEIFDPATGQFSPSASSLVTARSGHQAFLLPKSNAILVLGGSSAGTDLNSAELYYSWADSFQATGAMSVARPGLTGSASGQDGRFLAAGGRGLASTELYGFATVKTDKSDYAPGEIVTITGSGWKPGETVNLTLRELPNIDTPGPYTAVADGNGNISDTEFAPDSNDLNVRFYLTAVGQTSAFQAQNTFTDSTSFGNPSVGSQSPAGVLGGGSATFPVTVNFNGNGTCTVSLSVLSGLPLGFGSSFSPSSGTGTSSASVLSSTLTVTPPAAATPDSYSFTVRATGTAGNCAGTTKDGTGTLAVSGPATVLQVSGFPSPITAGTSGNFTVTAIDSHGNVAAGYAGTVHFTSSDAAATLPSDYTFTGAGTGKDNGSHTFSATLNTVGSNQSITATDAPRSLSASQIHINVTAPPTVAITVTTSPASLQVSLDGGATQAAPVTVNWVPGSTHTIATTSPQSGGTGTQYVWTSWSDGGALSHTITVPSTATTYTATFKTQYQLSLAVTVGLPGGSANISGGTDGTFYDSGTVLSLSATTPVADGTGERWRFDTWSGDASGSTSPVSVTMSAPRSVMANYVAQYQLTLAITLGVPSGLANITGGSDGTFYDTGTSLTLTAATPISDGVGKRWRFDNWSGGTTGTANPITFSITSAVTVTANYVAQYQLTLAITGGVPSGLANISGGSNGTFYDTGTSLTLTAATPVSDGVGKRWRFDAWSGDATGSTNPVSVTMSGPRSVTANYVVQFLVTFTQVGIGGDVNSTANVVTVNGGNNVFATPLYSNWFDVGSSVTYAYASPVASTVTGKRYVLTGSAPSPTSPFTVSTTYTITATYKAQFDTMTAVTSSVNPSLLGQSVTFTATVTTIASGGETPTGSVQFKVDGSNFGSGVGLSGGVATSMSTSTLTVGNHTVEADYTPDTDTYTSSVGMLTGGQTVQYNVCLLYDPTRSVKGGATYPLKLYLCDVNSNDVSSSGIVVHATSIFMTSGFTGAPEDAGNANPDSDFRFDSTLGPSGGYIFNLQTKGLASGSYGFKFAASNDLTTHTVLPGFGVR